VSTQKTERLGEDNDRKYLDEISRLPLLTREEEISLAKEIENGDEAAFERFVKSNLRLVVTLAKHYPKNRHLKFLDYVQEGNDGLITAVKKYDWRKGKFSTYGIWWIRKSIELAIKNSERTIRSPVHIAELLSQIRRATKELTDSLGRNPLTSEIAEYVGIEEEDVIMLLEGSRDTKSIQDPLSNESDSAEFGELLGDKNADCPEKITESKKIAENLQKAIDNLPEEEKRVFLLSAVEHLSTNRISKKLGVSFGMIEKIQKSAIKKLRTSEELKEFATNSLER
jgi:RNA polymerase primary sigma factor